MGGHSFGIDPDIVQAIAAEIRDVVKLGVQIGVVVGGGISSAVSRAAPGVWSAPRPTTWACLQRSSTLWPSRASSRGSGCDAGSRQPSRCGKWPNPSSAEGPPATWKREGWSSSRREPGTRTSRRTRRRPCARQKSQADVILKATKVDGVYDKDPMKHADATMYKKISYTETLAKNLKVMDATAISLCRENNIPITVFNIAKGQYQVRHMRKNHWDNRGETDMSEMTDLVFSELKDNMEKNIKSLEKSFSKIRTGRASLALSTGIKVEYPGAHAAEPGGISFRSGVPPDTDLSLGHQRHPQYREGHPEVRVGA